MKNKQIGDIVYVECGPFPDSSACENTIVMRTSYGSANSHLLLTRNEFRTQALTRDKGKCLICGASATEVHHIVDRRLFPDGGYYLANAASVCNPCHLRAEMTLITPDRFWRKLKVQPFIPPGYEQGREYTKWMDICLPSGARLPGPLFSDRSVQRVLYAGKVMHLYNTHNTIP